MSDTDLGPEDPAAAIAAEPRDPDTPSATEPPERARRGRWSGWPVIAVPMIVAAVAGGYEIGGPSLWRDEAYTKDAIGRPFGQIFALLGHQDSVHGAYYLLMHLVTAVIGTSATALRIPSLCAMVIATGFTAAAARRAAAPAPAPGPGRRLDVPALTGLLAGLLFATAPYMTYYAQMARSYAIETMFATIATYLLLRAWPDDRWRWWLAYAAAVALTGLFNIFGLLILAAHGVTLLLAGAGRTATNPAALAGRRGGRGGRAHPAARGGRPPAAADLVAGPAGLQGDRAADQHHGGLKGPGAPDGPARAGRPGRGLARRRLAPAQPGGDRRCPGWWCRRSC